MGEKIKFKQGLCYTFQKPYYPDLIMRLSFREEDERFCRYHFRECDALGKPNSKKHVFQSPKEVIWLAREPDVEYIQMKEFGQARADRYFSPVR